MVKLRGRKLHKNKRKGFTLLEVITTVVILGLVALIAVPTVNRIINNSRRNLYKQQEKKLIDAAKEYLVDNSSLLPTGTKPVYIRVQQLQYNNYLDLGPIINPLDNDSMESGCIKVKLNKGTYVYSYDKTCGGNRVTLAEASKIYEVDVNITNLFNYMEESFREDLEDTEGKECKYHSDEGMICSPFTGEQKEELLADYRAKFDVYRQMLSFSPKNILDMILTEVESCKPGLSEEDCEAEQNLRKSIIYDALGITDDDIPDATFDFNPVSLGIILNDSNRILDYTFNVHISTDQASFNKIRATFNKMYDNAVATIGEFLESGKLPFEIEGISQVPADVLLEEEGTLMMIKAAYQSFLEELDFRNYIYVINESETEHVVGIYLKELIKDTLETFETTFKEKFLEIASTYGEMDQEDIDRFLEQTGPFHDILEILNMEYGSKSTGELLLELKDLLESGYSGGTSSPNGPTKVNIGVIGLAFEFANVLIENYVIPRFPELTKPNITFEEVVEIVGHMAKDLLLGEWDYLVDTLDTLGAHFPKCDEGYSFVNEYIDMAIGNAERTDEDEEEFEDYISEHCTMVYPSDLTKEDISEMIDMVLDHVTDIDNDIFDVGNKIIPSITSFRILEYNN